MRRWRWPGIRRRPDPLAAHRCERLAEPEGCTERRKGRAAQAYRAVRAQSSRASRPYRGGRPTGNSEALNPRRGRSSNRASCPHRFPAELARERTAEPSSRWDRSSKRTRDISDRTCSDENVPQNQSRGCATPMRRIQSHREAKRRGTPPRARAPVDIQDGSFSVSPVSRQKAFVTGGRKSQDTMFENDTAGVKTDGVVNKRRTRRPRRCRWYPGRARSSS